MKIRKITYKKRLIIISTLVFTVIAALGILFIFGIYGLPTEKTIVKGSYNCQSEIKYTPIIQGGTMYNESNIEFGSDFISEFINELDLTCLYKFDCIDASDISGKYTVTAILEAKYSEENTIWKKEYLLCPEENFSANQTDKILKINLQDYRGFESSIEAETGLSTNATMSIIYSVNISAMVNNTPVTETSISTLIFPLDTKLLQFSGEPVSEIKKDVEESINSELKLNVWLILLNIIVILALIIALSYVLIYTKPIDFDPRKRQMEKFLKQNNDRIVELNNDSITIVNPVIVNSLNDLLLIADELKKPIFKSNSTHYSDTIFYVLDDSQQYVLYSNSL